LLNYSNIAAKITDNDMEDDRTDNVRRSDNSRSDYSRPSAAANPL
jgi:hypothetical protein